MPAFGVWEEEGKLPMNNEKKTSVGWEVNQKHMETKMS